MAERAGSAPEPMPPWHLHDLRRTGVTAMAGARRSWEVADKVLNHTQGRIHGVAAVYQRHEFLAERKAAFAPRADHVLAPPARRPVAVIRPPAPPRFVR